MKRGPEAGSKAAPTKVVLPPRQRAEAAWGAELPPEIEALVKACEASTAGAVATKLGYSSGLVSNLLARKYPGDVGLAFAKIRGALMGETVDCPILGVIPVTRCLVEQKRPFAATNSVRARLYHACPACPHNRKNVTEEAGQ